MKNILYIGVNDHDIDLFEGQYAVKNGMSYNSYCISDEKTAILDTVDARFGEEWLKNAEEALQGRAPDYLIVQHMEPDHSANIARFAARWPEATIVASSRAFTMMRQSFGTDYQARRLVVNDGSTLVLGARTLRFIAAPMVHWPEVIMTYDEKDKALFSADAFGKFGALDREEPWDDEARRYYIGIVGKYGAQVLPVLQKASSLDIRAIYPLHGPVLTDTIAHCAALYGRWAAYEPEEEGVVIAYASIYGHTRAAAEKLQRLLEQKGRRAVRYDLARCDRAEAVADAFRYDRLVLASVTYNGDLFPPMRAFLEALSERGFQRRTVAFIENGTWAPMAAKKMRQALEGAKNLTLLDNDVRILSALDAASDAALSALADAL